MIGHLGSRVSALLDGQLSPAEEERAWAHVHLCHVCRDAVEREGWVKTRLAGLGGTLAPDHLKGALVGGAVAADPAAVEADDPRRTGLVVIGGSAAGVALLGLLAVGLAAGPDVSPTDRRAPVTNLSGTESPRPSPSLPALRQRRDGVLTPSH